MPLTVSRWRTAGYRQSRPPTRWRSPARRHATTGAGQRPPRSGRSGRSCHSPRPAPPPTHRVDADRSTDRPASGGSAHLTRYRYLPTSTVSHDAATTALRSHQAIFGDQTADLIALGVTRIVLVARHIRLHVLRRHDFRAIGACLQLPGSVVRSGAGLLPTSHPGSATSITARSHCFREGRLRQTSFSR